MRLISLVLGVALAWGEVSFAQGSSDNPNLLMGEAIELYEAGVQASGSARTAAFREVDAILARIRTEFPDSIPAGFMASGTPLGPIDTALLAAELRDPLADLPSRAADAVVAVAGRFCAEADCFEETAETLAEFLLEVAFTDVAAAVDAGTLAALFSNPGQLGGNLERVNAFSAMLDDPAVLAEVDGRIADRLFGDMAAEAGKGLAISLVTNLATEVVAGHLEEQGLAEEAALVRTWAAPSKDIVLALGAQTAASAGASAVVIWAKNAYAFVELGRKTLDAEAAGNTPEQKLAEIAEDIDSLHRTLLTGVTTGPFFEGNEGIVVTPRMAEAFRQNLETLYELQTVWLASDEVALLETFDFLMEPAKAAARMFADLADEDETGQRTAALPPGVSAGTPAPDGFLGPPDMAALAATTWRVPDDPGQPVDAGATVGDVEVRADYGVLVFGRQVLGPVPGAQGGYTRSTRGPAGDYGIVLQEVGLPPGDPRGWITRLALVPRDPARPTIALAPDDVFRFSGSVAFTGDGRFALVEYNHGEFESDGLLVDLRSGRSGRIRSDRPADQVSTIAVGTARHVRDDVHSVAFRHLACAADDPGCGMATIAEAGTTTVLFRLPGDGGEGSADGGAPRSQADLLGELEEGMYGISPLACAQAGDFESDPFGDRARWVGVPEFSGGYESNCTILGSEDLGDAVQILAECNTEGEVTRSTRVWRIDGPRAFTDLTGRDAPKEYTLCADLDDRPAADLVINSKLMWSGAPQGIVGDLVVDAFFEDGGLRLTLRSAEGRWNPDARMNPVEAGARLDFALSVAPRRECDGCRPERTYESDFGLQFRDDRLTGPDVPMSVFIPEAELRANDLLSVSLRTDRIIFITDTTLRTASLLARMGGGGTACTDPSTLLPKADIIARFAGKGMDARPYGNRYAFMSFGAYDRARDSGTLETSFETAGGFETLTETYRVDEGRICTSGLANSGCSTVRLCDPDGSGVRLVMFDDRGDLYLDNIAFVPGAATGSAEGGRFTAPPGTQWMLVASRSTPAAAQAFAQGIGDGARVFRAQNGWFAVTAAILDEAEYMGGIADLVADKGWPADSLLTSGAGFVEELPPAPGAPVPDPAFTYTETLRETDLLIRSWRDGTPDYEFGGRRLGAGAPVVVWGRPDDLGDCLLSLHEPVFAKCADIAGFADSAAPPTGPEPEPAGLTFESIGGMDAVRRLIAATRWEASEDERALLGELVAISGSDFRRLGDLEKFSRLSGILGRIEARAGLPPGSMEVLNFARNSLMGPHPGRDEVRRDGAWEITERKSFHVIGIADPDRVEKYVRVDGAEAVFYNDPVTGWRVLADGVNDATYNYVNAAGLIGSGAINDNFQHTVLDVIPWVIWGATPSDTTSIPQRLKLFEEDPSYRDLGQRAVTRLAGLKPDDDPVTTNAESGRLGIATASGPELAALLRAHGVTAANARLVPGDDAALAAETERLIAAYGRTPPLVGSPDMPISGAWDAKTGTFQACMPRNIAFPEDRILGPEGYGMAAMVFVPSDPITGFGSLPAICVVDMEEVRKVEAIHGTGELARFGLDRPNGLFVRFGLSEADAAVFAEAGRRGEARVDVECEMRTMLRRPATATPYDYERLGTCVLKTLRLKAVDFETGDATVMSFSAGGEVFTPTSGLVTFTAPTPPPVVPDPTVARAAWSFETRDSGEDAVRAIVEGFEGTAAEIHLGYENAFPFQSAPAKRLAVEVFSRLPEDEVGRRAGTEAGYGSFVVKSWSPLNNHYFTDEPSPGIASAVVGTIDAIRILSVREMSAGTCEWSVTYRIWLRDPTPFGTALEALSDRDGHTFEACFRTTRDGYDIASYRYADG